MKKEIHPQYFPNATIECACGNKIQVGSTKKHIKVEVCSKCHPFFTGKAKLIDRAGRVERFKIKLGRSEAIKAKKKVKTKKAKK